MASSSLNSEGQKKICVMSLNYIKSSIIRKTSKPVCVCNKDVGLNLDDQVEHATTDLDCSGTVNGDCKNGICKHCGRTIRKPKPGFFKYLRKRFFRRNNNISSDSMNNKSSGNNKVISDAANSEFSSVLIDYKSKDNNINCNESIDKSYCGVSTSDMLDKSNNCSSNSNVGDQLADLGVPGKNLSCNREIINNSIIDASELVISVKSSESEITPALDSSCNSGIVDNLEDNQIDPDFQNSPLIPQPSPKTRSLTCELLKLSKYGWYWGPISREEAEEKLQDQPDGAFLVRDSSADHYLLSLSFRSSGKLLHTRIEHSQGLFSFYHQPEQEGFATVGELIEHSVSFSQSAVYCYSRPRSPGHPAFPVRLTKPVSRFTQVRSLQYLCRFVIRQYIRVDNIQNLPLPNRIKGYIQEGHY